MKLRELFCLAFGLSLMTFLLASCGGGGSNSHSAVVFSSIRGSAFKGPVRDGRIEIYRISDDFSTLTLIHTTSTEDDGSFNTNVGTYRGPVLLRVIEGTYRDEASGFDVNIAEEAGEDVHKMLTTVLPSLPTGQNGTQQTFRVAITPLTTMAAELITELVQNGDSIEDAAFKVYGALNEFFGFDIVNTIPHDVTSEDAGELTDEVRYGFVVAGLASVINEVAFDIDLDPDADNPLENIGTTSALDLLRFLSFDLRDGTLDGMDNSPLNLGAPPINMNPEDEEDPQIMSGAFFTGDLGAAIQDFIEDDDLLFGRNHTGLSMANEGMQDLVDLFSDSNGVLNFPDPNEE